MRYPKITGVSHSIALCGFAVNDIEEVEVVVSVCIEGAVGQWVVGAVVPQRLFMMVQAVGF